MSSMNYEDITGQKFNRLTVLERQRIRGSTRWLYVWKCKCDCGNIALVSISSLKRGDTKSCGCLNHENHYKHGQSSFCKKNNGKDLPTYQSWCAMLERCYRKNGQDFPRYGGRGILVCPEWRHDFGRFLKDMGERPAGRTLGRIDNAKGYSPQNCRWETHLQQCSNKSNNRFIEWRGETKIAAQWAREYCVRASDFHRWLKRGIAYAFQKANDYRMLHMPKGAAKVHGPETNSPCCQQWPLPLAS